MPTEDIVWGAYMRPAKPPERGRPGELSQEEFLQISVKETRMATEDIVFGPNFISDLERNKINAAKVAFEAYVNDPNRPGIDNTLPPEEGEGLEKPPPGTDPPLGESYSAADKAVVADEAAAEQRYAEGEGATEAPPLPKSHKKRY